MNETLTEGQLDRRAMFSWLRELKQIEAEKAELAAWHLAFMDDMNDRADRIEKREAEIRTGVETLAAEMRILGSEHVDVPGLGRIQFRTTPPSMRLADPERFIAWARDHERFDLLKTETVTKVAAADAKREQDKHTETLPGIEEVPEHTSMNIDWREPK